MVLTNKMFIDGLLRKQTEKKHSLKKASSNLLVDKIKLIVPFRMSELVLILRDSSPFKNVSVKEESVFFNNLQSIFLIVLRREDRLLL